ncbi:hypothetical protein M9H77_26037 [Catharanthus roseus]|uniref:Uncharacterized protein n=1 Tax=Catharanthus roseus TaxID=4058 RepID=A0ACC0A9E1_CATRO|nr:hypothetical protein M9H77_26037 [Catharanthus roseus]
MNFGSMAIEHMLATQSSSTERLPYGCFLTKVFQYFEITFFRPNDHNGIDGELIRGGQEEESENSEEEEEEEEGNEPEGTDEDEKNVEEIQRELKQKKHLWSLKATLHKTKRSWLSRHNEEEKIKLLKTLKTYHDLQN